MGSPRALNRQVVISSSLAPHLNPTKRTNGNRTRQSTPNVGTLKRIYDEEFTIFPKFLQVM